MTAEFLDKWAWLVVPSCILFFGGMGKLLITGFKWHNALFGLELTVAGVADAIATVLEMFHANHSSTRYSADVTEQLFNIIGFLVIGVAMYLIILVAHKLWEPKLRTKTDMPMCVFILVFFCNAIGFLTLAGFMRYNKHLTI
jgi:hypothetical protein